MMFQFLEEIKQQIKQGGVATVSVATAKKINKIIIKFWGA